MIRNWLPRSLVVLVAMLAFAGTAATASAQDKLDRALREGQNRGKAQRVIVKAKPGYEAWARQLLAQNGKKINGELPSVNGFAVELSASELALCKSAVLDGCSEDSYISPSGATTSETTTDATYSASSINTLIGTLGFPTMTVLGEGVTVALIDSGIYPSAAFSGRIKAFYDFTGGTIQSKPAFDDYGHGTHVAGLIGGLPNTLDVEFEGVAPSVQFVGLKVLDQNGGGRTSDVIRAVEFAIANKRKFDIDIINLSLGHPIFEPAANDPLVQAVEKASKAGIIVVVSAGNHGVNDQGEVGFAGITSPGNAPSAITVGAANHNKTLTRDDDRLAAYSSNGPTWYDGLVKPDVVAPGHFLASEVSPNSSLYKTYPSLRTVGKSGKTFMRLSGTSMSAGVVSGVVAVMKQVYPKLTPNLAKALLQYTAIPMHDKDGAAYSPLRQGTGEVNALGAAMLAYTIDSRITGTTTPWVSMEPFSTIGDQTYAWAKNIVWGDNVVWGDSVYYNLPIFTLNVVWGNNVVSGQKVLWGDSANIVWGNNIVWGENIVWGNNIVWGENLLSPLNSLNTFSDDNIVWGNLADDNIVWGNNDNIVWGNSVDDNIVWGNRSSDDNIVWGNRSSDDNIVWGNKAAPGNNGKGGK